MLKKMLISFLFLLSQNLISQENITSDSYLSTKFIEYNNELKMNSNQMKKFKNLLEVFNIELKEVLKDNHKLSAEEKRKFNKLVKLNDQKFFKFLNPKQFEIYLISRKKIESFKNYKI